MGRHRQVFFLQPQVWVFQSENQFLINDSNGSASALTDAPPLALNASRCRLAQSLARALRCGATLCRPDVGEFDRPIIFQAGR
jgi:hypothetical protein